MSATHRIYLVHEMQRVCGAIWIKKANWQGNLSYLFRRIVHLLNRVGASYIPFCGARRENHSDKNKIVLTREVRGMLFFLSIKKLVMAIWTGKPFRLLVFFKYWVKPCAHSPDVLSGQGKVGDCGLPSLDKNNRIIPGWDYFQPTQ